MEYKVKPFIARVGNSENSDAVARQVQEVIERESVGGWEFVCTGNIDTEISGSNGCFGIGAKPGSATSIMVLVFRK
jgi:hypothetical protein